MNGYDRQRAQTEQRRSDGGCLISAGVDVIHARDRSATIRVTCAYLADIELSLDR